MDIRNFFAKSKAGAPAKAPAAAKNKSSAKANALPPTASRGNGSSANSRKKAVADCDSGSDTEMEDEVPQSKIASSQKKKRLAADSGSDTQMEDGSGNDIRGKANGNVKKKGIAVDSDSDTDMENEVASAEKSRRNKIANKEKKALSVDSGDETEMEDGGGNDDDRVAGGDGKKKTTTTFAKKSSSNEGKKRFAAHDSGDDSEEEEEMLKRYSRYAKKEAVDPPTKKKAFDSDASTEEEKPLRKKTSPYFAKGKISSGDEGGKKPEKPAEKLSKKKINSSSSDEEVERQPPRGKSPRKRRKVDPRSSGREEGRRKIFVCSDSDDDDRDFEIKKPSPRKAAKAGRKSRAAAMLDSDEEDDNDEEMAREGDDDEDFKPKSENESDEEEEDYEEDEEVVVVKKSNKRRAGSPARSSPTRSSPRRTSPRKKSTPQKQERDRPARLKTEPKEEPAKKKAKKGAPKKEEKASGPPKYHPPSSKLMTHVPFLEDHPDVKFDTPPPLPKLPNNDPNFSIDALAPRCLDGLAFVFTGVLSTDAEATRRTNQALQIGSPSRGDYYANRNVDCDEGGNELSREGATDIVKSLGGRVTSAVSGKTDYLVCGAILEDGRDVEEGGKYKRALGLWKAWGDKWRDEYSGKKGKKKTKAQMKDKDPNSLIEVVNGIHEFYGLVRYFSNWKGGTPLEGEEEESPAKEEAKAKDEPASASKSPSVAANPYAAAGSASSTPANPYVKGSTPTNPYARKSTPTNPYAKPTGAVSNPYARKSPANPYTRKSPSNPYATPSAASTPASRPAKSDDGDRHPTSGRELAANSLWADKYAPSSSEEILGNGDSVRKLRTWLNRWEGTFNDPGRPVKGLSAPNGPRKAALLSGPPGIGKTTTATLVARESGRDVLELNASDARSKKTLSQALGDVTGSQVLSFDNMDSKKRKCEVKKRCIIMDEVDGMGAGDRSGISELIQMVKKSKVPIICICNDRQSQKIKSLVQYCMDLRYRRPTKMVIARRAVEIGRNEGMDVEVNAAEAMAESCGNDIRQVLNSLQMWSCKGKRSAGGASMTYRDLKERQGAISKDEVLRVSMFDACRQIVEGSRGLAGGDSKAVTASLLKRTDAYFVDYMLMGLMVHQNYPKVCVGQFNGAKLSGDEDAEVEALNRIYDATLAMSDFGMCEESLRGGDQNWSLLPLCSVLAVKVGHHAGGPTGGFLPGYPEFAGWLGKNSSRNKKIRLLQELRRHVNYKVSADAPELRMNYLPIMRAQFEALLFDKEGAHVTEAIELMDEYGLDRDDVFENLDEFVLESKHYKTKKFGDLDSKSKSAFTRAYNSMAHTAQALVSEQGAEKMGRKKGGGGDAAEAAELDVVDDDKAAGDSDSDEEEDEDLEALRKKFMKKGRKGKGKGASGKAKAASSKSNGKKRKS